LGSEFPVRAKGSLCRRIVRTITASSNMRSTLAINWQQISQLRRDCASLQRRSSRLRHFSSCVCCAIGADRLGVLKELQADPESGW